MKVSSPTEPERVIDGYICAVATPIAALAAWRLRFGRQDVRTLVHELGRQADRQLAGKRRAGSRSNSGGDHSAGNLPEQDRQGVVRAR